MEKLFFLPAIFSVLALCLGTAIAEEKEAPAAMKPSDGWTVRIDTKGHIPKMPDMVVSLYCKRVSGGLTECQLYDSDKPDAHLIGIEMVVDAATYNKFSKKEKALWHLDTVLPDVSPEEAMRTHLGWEKTYGKVYILWNPAKSEWPEGKPVIPILH